MGQVISPADVATILPVRNRPALLRQAIRSVADGIVVPREVIVILDGRGSEQTADEEAAQECASALHARGCLLIVLPGPALGPAAARNLGAARARTEWLSFLDSDDLWRPEKLSEQLRFLESRPQLDAAHTTETWVKNGVEIPVPDSLRPTTGRPLRESFSRCLVSASSVMIRRRVFFELGGFDASLRACEDFDLWIRFFLKRPMGLVPGNPHPPVIKRAGDWDQLSATRGIDMFRVRSLLKILSTEELRGPDRLCAVSALQTRWKIIRAQSEKYGRPAAEDLAGIEEQASRLDLALTPQAGPPSHALNGQNTTPATSDA